VKIVIDLRVGSSSALYFDYRLSHGAEIVIGDGPCSQSVLANYYEISPRARTVASVLSSWGNQPRILNLTKETLIGLQIRMNKIARFSNQSGLGQRIVWIDRVAMPNPERETLKSAL
jgi:hypothetical protein